jgi:hypothetical protein
MRYLRYNSYDDIFISFPMCAVFPYIFISFPMCAVFPYISSFSNRSSYSLVKSANYETPYWTVLFILLLPPLSHVQVFPILTLPDSMLFDTTDQVSWPYKGNG